MSGDFFDSFPAKFAKTPSASCYEMERSPIRGPMSLHSFFGQKVSKSPGYSLCEKFRGEKEREREREKRKNGLL